MSSDFARAVLDWGPPFTREKVVFDLHGARGLCVTSS